MNVKRLKQILNTEPTIDWEAMLDSLEPTIEERFDSEIGRVLDELETGPHADSKEYRAVIDALQELVNARNSYKNCGSTEEAPHKSYKNDRHNEFDWNVIVPILIKAGVSLAAIIFWICLEQGRPSPMRLVQWTNQLLIPR